MYNWLAYFVVSILGLLLADAAFRRWGPAELIPLFRAGAVIRVVATVVRYTVMVAQYGHAGDSQGYFGQGLRYSQRFMAGDLGIFDQDGWRGGHFWGTQFVQYVSAFVCLFIGDSMRASYVVFALVGYAGLVLLVLAFRDVYGPLQAMRLARWVWLWPSLWFWPSTIGKDSLILLAAGLATAGYVGGGRHIRWSWFLAGISLALLVRPHIAAAMAIAVLVADVAQGGRLLQGRNLGRGVLVLLISVWFTNRAASQLGIDAGDYDSFQEQFEELSSRTETGGSQIGKASGVLGLPVAVINVLFRPFPWEARHVFSLAASAEMWIFWVVVWRERKALVANLRRWREQRILRFTLPFLVLGIVMFGYGFANMGILSRQRVLLLPFMFMILVARYKVAQKSASTRLTGPTRESLPSHPVSARNPTPAPPRSS